MNHKVQPLKCRDKWLHFDDPVIMGVINLTEDSFYSGSRIVETDAIITRMKEMEAAGAEVIDLGAMSSRPGAAISSPERELELLLPVLQDLPADLDVIVSIDTIHSKVARGCLDKGAHIINDITAGHFDEKMVPTVVENEAAFIAMHMRGMPEDMKSKTQYEKGVSAEVLSYLINRIRKLRSAGLHDLVIDPGFGFAKTIGQNFRLLKDLSSFNVLDCPLLVGISRKSMIWKTLEISPDEALNGTTAVHMLALNNGADILRVHDVKEATECVKIWKSYSEPDDL